MANKSIMMSVEFRSKLDSFLVALNAMHAKHARGNLFSASNGMEAIGPNGYVKYLI